jgi:hypothetical protein
MSIESFPSVPVSDNFPESFTLDIIPLKTGLPGGEIHFILR